MIKDTARKDCGENRSQEWKGKFGSFGYIWLRRPVILAEIVRHGWKDDCFGGKLFNYTGNSD